MSKNDTPVTDLAFIRERVRRSLSLGAGRVAALLARLDRVEAESAALRSAAKTAATLLVNLNQRGGLGLDVHAAINQTLAPLDAALASDAGRALLDELAAARILAPAVERYHTASRAAERNPALRGDLAAAAYRLGEALATYHKAARAEAHDG